MSKPMARSFRKALDEALADVRKVSHSYWRDFEKAQYDWRKTHASEFEKISLQHDIERVILQRQREALYVLEEELNTRTREAKDRLEHQCWEELQAFRDNYKETLEANSKEWKEIEAGIVAKYAERMQTKQSA
jgi:regulator of PEP synthase PpsR (kinase-PPPase family)